MAGMTRIFEAAYSVFLVLLVAYAIGLQFIQPPFGLQFRRWPIEFLPLAVWAWGQLVKMAYRNALLICSTPEP
jgi:hypothetical protein